MRMAKLAVTERPAYTLPHAVPSIGAALSRVFLPQRVLPMSPRCRRRDFLAHAGLLTIGGAACCAVPGRAEAAKAARVVGRYDSYCGIYCGSCKAEIESEKATNPAQLKCLGCKSRKVADHCLKCTIKACALQKKVEQCCDCKEYPCEQLKAFHHNGRDYRLVAAQNLETIRKDGVKKWLAAQQTRWTCPKCKGRFGLADKACPNCGGKVNTIADEAATLKSTNG